MNSCTTPREVPRSAFDRTGGIVYLARMLDQVRLRAAGKLREDFHANLGGSFDSLPLAARHPDPHTAQ